MEQQTKYGAVPEERSKTAQGSPGTKEPRQPQPKKKPNES